MRPSEASGSHLDLIHVHYVWRGLHTGPVPLERPRPPYLDFAAAMLLETVPARAALHALALADLFADFRMPAIGCRCRATLPADARDNRSIYLTTYAI